MERPTQKGVHAEGTTTYSENEGSQVAANREWTREGRLQS